MKKFKGIGILSCILVASIANAKAILNIVPSSTSVNVRSDSQGYISYTVKNDTTQPISNFIITPNYLTTGQVNGVNLGTTNTCTAPLAPSETCNFVVQIQGANQPNQFQVTPQVCGYAGIFCNVPYRKNHLQVTVNNVGTAYAYFSVISGANFNTVVPVNTTTLELGTPFAADLVLQNGLAVSPDGTRVYAGELDGSSSPTSNFASILVLTSGANPQLVQKVDLGYYPYLAVIAVTPDGKTVYVTASENPTIYRIDNIAGIYTPSPIVLPNSVTPAGAEGLAISPDGSKIFITNYTAAALYIMDASNNAVVQTLTNAGTSCEFDAPLSIVVSPDGNTVYVANDFGTVGVSVVQKNNNGTYSCGTRIITNPAPQLSEMAITPDGRYLYVLGYNFPQVLIVIDTSTNTQITYYTLPGPLDGSYAGISIAPDGSKLFISNNYTPDSTSYSSYFYTLSNGLPSGDLTPINIGGGSQTFGSFVG